MWSSAERGITDMELVGSSDVRGTSRDGKNLKMPPREDAWRSRVGQAGRIDNRCFNIQCNI